MLRYRLPALVLACLLAACTKALEPIAGSASALALLLSPEDLRTVGAADRAQGPVITGSIQPERRADLRAELSAVVLQVLKENGEAVRTGELLVKLDDTAIRDSLSSSEESARAADQAYEQAERQVQRLRTLQAQGMTSLQALEDAEIRRNSARSELAAARARVVSARLQLQRTLVRAPFDGVISDRKVSVGDTAQIGKELTKVIDPRSMRFEGLVSAHRMQDIQVGQDVRFRINGAPMTEFIGKVRRVDASANTNTRQVEVLVAFADPREAPRVAGLYAEGWIAAPTGSTRTSMLPSAAIVKQGEQFYVWRVRDRALDRVAVRLGERDPRSGEYPVLDGVAAGEQILGNPGSSLAEGQKVEFAGDSPPRPPLVQR